MKHINPQTFEGCSIDWITDAFGRLLVSHELDKDKEKVLTEEQKEIFNNDIDRFIKFLESIRR